MSSPERQLRLVQCGLIVFIGVCFFVKHIGSLFGERMTRSLPFSGSSSWGRYGQRSQGSQCNEGSIASGVDLKRSREGRHRLADGGQGT